MRWLVILLLLASCAESTEGDLDAPADRPTHCAALNELVCDMCDPERTVAECSPASIEEFCRGTEWYCAPTPTIGQALECRRAFARALSDVDCTAGEELLVPECQRFDACDP